MDIKLPKEFINLMREQLGGEAAEFFSACAGTGAHRGIRVNTLKSGAFDALSAAGIISGEQVPWCPDGYYAADSAPGGNHPYHICGLFYFQEPSAMCAVEGLGIEPGDTVLDLCAAPGGKATQAAAKLAGKGLLVANEIVPKRAAVLADNIARMGVKNAVVTNERPQRLAAKYPCFFDKIIVDAPCSGEGMFRKEPQALEEWSLEHSISCGERQKSILASAYEMLKPGGYLLYSTCTFSKYENELVAAHMADTYDVTIEPMPALSMLSPGIGALAPHTAGIENTRRIYPHRHGGEGHFAALFKKGGTQNTSPMPSEAKPKKKKPASKQDPVSDAVKLWRGFEEKYLNTHTDGAFALFGEHLYLVPDINTDGIKTVRGGQELGVCKKNRFEPSWALASALGRGDIRSTIRFEPYDSGLFKYLTGDVIGCEASGWCAVCAGDFPIGWVKASGGIGKNRLPARMRIHG